MLGKRLGIYKSSAEGSAVGILVKALIDYFTLRLIYSTRSIINIRQ